jgi:hypothetical protein
MKQLVHKAALIPHVLFATIETPIPVPHIKIPLSHIPSATATAAGAVIVG